MKFNHTQEAGRSMVEMLGVLAIVGVLSVGGIAGYSQAMSKFKVTKAMDQVQTIITNMRTLYASSRKYSKISAAEANSVGILTTETFQGGDAKTGINPFGGEIIFDIGTDARTFTVEYTKLTPEACVKMATADWGADESSGLKSITVGGNGSQTYKWASDGGADNTVLPVSVAEAVVKCGSNTAATTVKWEYR